MTSDSWKSLLPAEPVLLEEMAWPRIGEIIARGPGLLLLPVGATEQHGPHLPINTDTVIASACCHYASALTGTPVMPAINYSVSIGHTEKWPGTFSLFHETFIASIRELAAWCVATGWKRLLIVNAHFGNDASLRVAVDRLRFDFSGRLLVGLKNTYALTPEIWRYFISDAEDLHANKAETDLMLHLAPERVRMEAVQDDPDRTGGCVFSHMVANTSVNGVTGKPSEGWAERGAELFAEMGVALAAAVDKAKGEEAPLEWVRAGQAWG
jgi:creatinine amidohydrolase